MIYMRAEIEKAEERRVALDDNRRNAVSPKSSSPVQRFRTLSEFQKAMQSHPPQGKLIIVSPAEVDADSDDSDSSDSSDSSIEDDNHHDGNATRICRPNREAAIEHMEYTTTILSLKGGGQEHRNGPVNLQRCERRAR